jgi:hypothetical protein
MMEKLIISKLANDFFFSPKNIIRFVNVETESRLGVHEGLAVQNLKNS